ncbi:MAG: TetR/AcrR family transcriptional regulator [Sneathiellales bacterium]|nr:TetR/AcrR family transcriptional regulator [Sneathiellales bacterium]
MGKQETRDRIVEKADDLFYQQGFEKTSFADIADQVGISRGNFYHHFKSKDDILTAVIDRRMEKTKGMLKDWERETQSPAERIGCYIQILIANQAKIRLYGCPVGTLTAELSKLDHLAQEDAARIFTLFRNWLKRQFQQMGFTDRADEHALHIVGRSQGVATLYQAYKDDTYLNKEVQDMKSWLATLTA